MRVSFQAAFLALSAALLMACGPPPVQAAAPPSPTNDIAPMIEAWRGVGGLRTRGRLSASGLAGTFESVEDLRSGRYVDRYDLGALRGATGFDGTAAWTEDSSGVARPEAAAEPARAARSEAWRRARAYWFAERGSATITELGERREQDQRYRTLRVTPTDGIEFELWLDADSGLPARAIQKEGSQLMTTSYSDYRQVAGGPAALRVPYRIRQSTGDPRFDSTFEVERVEFDPTLAADAFAMPPPPARDFGIARDAASTSVPFRIWNGHVFVSVRLNGQGPFRFLLDTGGMNLMTPRTAARLGLDDSGRIEVRGTGEGNEEAAVATVGRVALGSAFVMRQTFFVLDVSPLERVEGIAIDGLIGYEVFRRFIVRIDYERNVLTLSDPARWSYRGAAESIPFDFNEHVPQIDGSIDGLAGKFDIDTGSRSSVDLFAPFVARHRLDTAFGPTLEAITGWGIGGPSRGRVARGTELRLGNVSVSRPVVELSSARQGAFAADFVAGNVGYGILKRFNITFDYGNRKLWLEPNRNFASPDIWDRGGLWVNLASDDVRDGFEVVEVIPGGPAAQAGIRVGDRIVAVGGRKPRGAGLHGFRRLLKTLKPGSRLPLEVASPSSTREVTLIVRDLI